MSACLYSRAALAVGACCAVFAAVAEPAPQAQGQFDPMIITASRVAESLDETLWPVTVIDRAQIEASQVNSVQDLLKGVAGVSITNSGGLGKATSVFMRGTESDHVLVLVDGVRVGSSTAGTTAFEFLPVEQIERVEIVRGPRSTLYGSDAIGGVIQFFTRKGSTEPALAVNASASAGSHDLWRSSAGLSASGNNAWVNFSVDRAKTQGFNACRAAFTGGCFANEPDADGFRSDSGSLRAGYRFSDDAEVEIKFLDVHGHSEFDGFYNSVDFVQRAGSVTGRLAAPLGWAMTAQVGRSEDRQNNFSDGVYMSRFDTRRDSFGVQADHAFALGQLSLGLDYYNDTVNSNTQFDVTERDNKAAFAQFLAKRNAHSLLFGVRHDNNEQFGGNTIGNVGWGWSFAEGLRATATVGSGFHAPSFNDLYYPGFSNPNLDPEESRSMDVGLQGDLAAGRWSLHAFRTDIDDLIAFDNTLFVPVNVRKARIHGVEAELGWTVREFDVTAQATWLEPKNRSNDADEGNWLPRRAKQTARLDVRRKIGPLLLGTTGVWEGRRFDDVANTVEVGSFCTLDLTAEYGFARHWSIGARLANAFDRDYSTINFYNQDGRNWSLTLRYR